MWLETTSTIRNPYFRYDSGGKRDLKKIWVQIFQKVFKSKCILLYHTMQRQQTIDKHKKLMLELEKNTRTCDHCNTNKSLLDFHKRKAEIGGYCRYCKDCCRERYYVPNKDKYKERAIRWQKENPEKNRAMRKREKNKPYNRLRARMSCRLNNLVDMPIDGKRFKFLGCSIEHFKQHIESLWSGDMNWENYGKSNGWVLDHIIPCNVFNHSIEQHLHWCWNYRNLRPMKNSENSSKSDIVEGISVREYNNRNRKDKLNELISNKLESMGICSKAEYLNSLVL